MIVKVKKIWYGSVSVRDYIVRDCQKRGEDLHIEHDGQIMVVPNDQLGLGRSNRINLKSNFKNEVYDLIDFPWRPTKKVSGYE